MAEFERDGDTRGRKDAGINEGAQIEGDKQGCGGRNGTRTGVESGYRDEERGQGERERELDREEES